MSSALLPAPLTLDFSVEDVVLHGDLVMPPQARGVVLFAQGGGSSRMSPRTRTVAAFLNQAGFGTVLLDLLTEHEAQVDDVTHWYRFEVDLLAHRLIEVAEQLTRLPATRRLPIGCFGASTGAAAALVAAAARPELLRTVVSRGGRPDLAGHALRQVHAPTCLIVGGADREILSINAQALGHLHAAKSLEIIPGATHLFLEPGALEQVSRLGLRWLGQHLAPPLVPRSDH